MQVRLNRRGAVAKPPTVDREVLHDSLDIIACLGEGNPLNPIDGVDLGIARITVLCHPLLNPAAARIVSRKGQNEGAAIVLEECGNFSSAHLRIVDRVGDQTLPIVGHPKPLGGVSAGCWCVTCINPTAFADDMSRWSKPLSVRTIE